ncbi:Cell division protein FtsY-like protein [Bibersteinia trehalosi USDA-ARS-USMARC-190]|uniref:Signal recognition particle receptor FtsY n=2 Tax=Bibersteinia trehalosi TaxID=47735 RepID=W0RCV7_BIBTR|nr:Cell division protein FtsY-like protein [Bibersteinia trehalosi USDA-ARS-USMARC-190]
MYSIFSEKWIFNFREKKMAEEKKKGFWSWLGFGKKEEQAETVATIEEESEGIVLPQDEAVGADNVHPSEPEITDVADDENRRMPYASTEPPEEQAVEISENSANASEEITTNEETTGAENVRPSERETTDLVDDENGRMPYASTEPLGEQAVEISENSANASEEITTSEENVGVENVRPSEREITDVVDDENGRMPYAPTEQLEEQALESSENSAKSNEPETQEKPSEGGFFSRLIKGLIKTKQNIGSGFRNLFRGKKIDDELFEELEEQLLIADLGMPTTTKIINNLTQHATKAQLRDAEQLYVKLKDELAEVLKPVAQPLVLENKKPYVILMVGVNGVGKTTTIGKLARKFQAEGKSVMLAAGDTFRAAAVEQLQVWGERNQIPVVAQATGADSASVIFDAMQSAAAKGIDVLIADTAGRLQNKNNLMDELKKIVRVMKKYDETAPHEIMLTLDAGTGQNAISQAKLFNEAVGLTGITLTKLDGTAKGGVIFAIADQFNIPIRYIGVGEKIDDLRPFNAEEFIEALFSHEDEK